MSTKTKHQLRKEARNKAIVADFEAMMMEPGSMVTAVEDRLMVKHKVSRFTVQEARRIARGIGSSYQRQQAKLQQRRGEPV